MKIYMNSSAKYLIALFIIGFLSACGTGGNSGENSVTTGSGQLVSAQVIDDINASTMLQVVRGNIDANATNAFGYKAVKITYNTTGQNGEAVVASGLLVIPTATPAYQSYRISQGEQPFSVSMLCDNHGTIFLNSKAPSNVEVSNGLPDYKLAVLMTGYAGFAGIYPDYIGFGDSNGTVHPYIMKKASATSGLDMIKASMKYMQDNNIILNYQLYITGYSEGGYNAMALAQKVEESFNDRVNLMGVAPMAGPYNVEALADIELNASRTMAYPAFLADLAYSYATYYDDLNISDITLQPEAVLAAAFDGTHDTVAINVILGLANGTTDYGFYTHKTNELFKDSFITKYQSTPNAPIHTRFIENNVDNWTPGSKMNLIQCVDDDIIPFSESNNTYTKFSTAGADVTLTPIPTSSLSQQVDTSHPFVHVNCVPTAYETAVNWFNAIRQGNI